MSNPVSSEWPASSAGVPLVAEMNQVQARAWIRGLGGPYDRFAEEKEGAWPQFFRYVMKVWQTLYATAGHSAADAGARLELGMDGGGPRHSLDGQPVNAGTPLEVQLEDGTWLAGTYEWSFQEGASPHLTIRVCGTGEPCALRLAPRALLRWPKDTGEDPQ